MLDVSSKFTYELRFRSSFDKGPRATEPDLLTIRHSHWESRPTYCAEEGVVVAGDLDSFLVSTSITRRSTNLKNIPVNAIGYDRLLSREFIGCDVKLYQICPFPSTNLSVATNRYYEDLLFTGKVTGQQLNQQTVDFEITSLASDMGRASRYYVSNSCVNTLGQGTCQFVTFIDNYLVQSIDNFGTEITFGPTSHPFVNTRNYELYIGVTGYLIQTVLAPNQVKIRGSVTGFPKYCYIREHCNLSIESCARYGQLDNFNGNPMLLPEAVNANV